MNKIKKITAPLAIIAAVLAGFLSFSGNVRAAGCQLIDTFPQVAINKAFTGTQNAVYATGETVTATVRTKQDFNCDGYQVQFMFCPINGYKVDCSLRDSGKDKVVTVQNGSAAASWQAIQFNNFKTYTIKAAAGTDNPNVGSSWQHYSSWFDILPPGNCGITNFTALKNSDGTLINFNVTTNNQCESKAVGVQLNIINANTGKSSGGTVSSGTIKNGAFAGTWTIDPNLPGYNFTACVTGGNCQDSGINGTKPVIGTDNFYSCKNNQCTADPNGTYTTASCDNKCGSGGGPGKTQVYPFKIPNPLKGGANDFTSLVKIIAQWIFNLAIPIAVAMIVYAGILFLTAQGEPAKVTKAKEVLKYAVIGLAIILIGSGFVTLIQSILELGGTGTTQTQNQNPGSPSGPQQPATTNGAVGNICSKPSDCFTGLTCKNTICTRQNGNLASEACVGPTNCASGLDCDKSDAGIQVIDGQTLGSCIESANPAPIIITANETSPAVVGQAYTMDLSATGGGSTTFSWSVVGGTLPPGLNLSVFGAGTGNTISGIPETAGTYTFVLNAKNDTTGQSGGKSVTIKVNKP